MKYIIFVCDGENGNARKMLIDSFSSKGMHGGIINENGNRTQRLLSSFGFNTDCCENCAAPFIAAAEGIQLAPDDFAAELEFLSSDKISQGEAEMLADGLNSRFGFGALEFYACDGENGLLVLRQNAEMPDEGECADAIRNSSVNEKRKKKGLNTADGCRITGRSTKTYLPEYYSLVGKRCALAAKNSIVRGIARLAKIELYDFDGPDEDFLSKAQAALNAFDDGFDASFVHFNHSKEMLQNADTALTFTVNGLRARGEDYGVLILFDSSYILYLPNADRQEKDITRADAVKILFECGDKYGK